MNLIFIYLFFSIRKGVPIETPESRRNRRSSSSHNYLSPINTLDGDSVRIKPAAAISAGLLRTSSSLASFPLKVDRLPSSFQVVRTPFSADAEDDIIKVKVATDSADDPLKGGTRKVVSLKSSSDESDGDGKEIDFRYFDKAPKSTVTPWKGSPIVPKIPIVPKLSNVSSVSPTVSSVTVSPTVFSRTQPQKAITSTLNISNIQYRLLIIPPSKSIHKYESMHLLFVQNERMMVFTANINASAESLVLPFAKVARIQFIRQAGFASSADWYIDFVLVSGYSLDFKTFKVISDDPDLIDNCMTLRVNLARNCGLSSGSIENILLSIITDRRAFHFSACRDRYGEFERSQLSSYSPPPKLSKTKTKTMTVNNLSLRAVPSLDKLSSSESVQIAAKSPLNARKWTLPTGLNSPDIFDGPRRTSKRLKSPIEKKSVDSSDFTYVDPDFETERTV